MKIATVLILGSSLMMSGCIMHISPVSSDDSDCSNNQHALSRPYIDAYVYLPDAVAWLIEGRVAGYSMPPVSRYSSTLYPVRTNESWNLPSYVRSDFNGDGSDDHALMFSRESYTGNSWFLTTKLLIVASDGYGGYDVTLDLILGTVSASWELPVEEYWGIRLMKRGVHTLTTYYGGATVEESVTLDNDAVYLASLDPDERSVLHLIGSTVYEMRWDLGAIAKRKASTNGEDSRSSRIIQLKQPPAPKP